VNTKQPGRMGFVIASLTVVAVSCVSSQDITSVPGIPGQDYPTLDVFNLPATSFDCGGRINGGFYTDLEAFCQMYHMCVSEAGGSFRKYSFLCPNGTMFNQDKLVCDAWFNVECSDSQVDVDTGDLDLLEAERDLITLGEETGDPYSDFPWRFRDDSY